MKWIGFIPVVIIAISLTFQHRLNNSVFKYYIEKLGYSDQKSKRVNEAVTAIRVVKFNVWEHVILKAIEKIRNLEVKACIKFFNIRAFSDAAQFTQPMI